MLCQARSFFLGCWRTPSAWNISSYIYTNWKLFVGWAILIHELFMNYSGLHTWIIHELFRVTFMNYSCPGSHHFVCKNPEQTLNYSGVIQGKCGHLTFRVNSWLIQGRNMNFSWIIHVCWPWITHEVFMNYSWFTHVQDIWGVSRFIILKPLYFSSEATPQSFVTIT